MLHSRVYNECLPRELQTAFVNRDREALLEEIRRMSLIVSESVDGSVEENLNISKLYVAIALYDSVVNSGETVSFMTDFINL